MKTASKGDKVKAHYTGTLSDGTVFDSSRERDPLEFTLGNGQLIKGFELAIGGMSVGDSKTINIPAAEAYGERNEDMLISVPKDQFPPQIEAKVGEMLSMRQKDGGMLDVTITAIEEDSVTLDANHPLAGKDLTFEIEVTDIAEA